ncbi:DUF6266 family protein [Pedobacter frigoris]|uniref:Uncharacterized protein n=1 Tax=Pedobacter frigoris TaxID=2571272 RepID=A0A4U1CMQ5_9SPHI|nr:DUF6266 family protein [Pedobacter frigoris]TKC09161.1 hypothetical protein FA047_03440 [Pedobacter frigoris]
MARLKDGIFGMIVGKLGNLISYDRLGENVVRMKTRKPKRKKPRTPAQQAVNIRFSLVKSFVSAGKDFISVGFAADVKGTTRIPENGAVSYNLKHAVIGEFPDFQLDFENVLVSKGKLPTPEYAAVTREGNLLKFTWSTTDHDSYPRNRDQAMMFAYFPGTNDSVNTEFITNGALRSKGQDELDIGYHLEGATYKTKKTSVEVYLAFISDDRKDVSNSLYLGNINLEE